MTSTLAQPSYELAERVLGDVEYAQRIVGLKMAAMGGSNPSDLHSLAQVAKFIHVDDYETALHDNQATVGYIDPGALSRWVAEVLGDDELAGAILERAPHGEFYGAIAMPLKDLLLERLEQCRTVLEAVGPDQGV